jgi:hypothetical protein
MLFSVEVSMNALLKQKFLNHDRVVIQRTNSELDGQYCEIIGISYSDPVVDFYIVLLDNPKEWSAITLIESCLDRLSN